MDWKKTLATVAPTIATALGGPLAGMAVKVVADALGIEPNESAIEDMLLAGDPETLYKLKQIETNFKLEIKRLGIELEQLHSDDRKDARGLAKLNMVPQVTLSVIYTLGYFVVMWQFLTGTAVIPLESTTSLNILLGVLTAAQVQIMNFWFGSSHGSKIKDN